MEKVDRMPYCLIVAEKEGDAGSAEDVFGPDGKVNICFRRFFWEKRNESGR